MSNRSYLYSLGNRPTSYADRPETVSGLSEWPYDVPFMYRLLMSGDPQLCASLVSDGFETDEPEHKTALYAISSSFDPGFERLKRFVEIVRALAVPVASPELHAQAAAAPSLVAGLKRLFSPRGASVPSVPSAAPLPTASTEQLVAWLDETLVFLESHRDRYLLLETVELDCMSEDEESALRACVEQEIARCLHVGAAVDALPADIAEAVRLLRKAAMQECEAPLDAFFGLRLDDDCDSTDSDETEYPLGLQWSEVLYFGLSNRAEFEAQRG